MKVRTIIAGIVAPVLLAVAVPSSAQAVIGCPSGALCLYDSNLSSATPFYDLDDADINPGECRTLGISLRNRATYIWNRSAVRWAVYTGSSCSATSGPIYPNSQGNMTGAYYQTIDSFRYVSLG